MKSGKFLLVFMMSVFVLSFSKTAFAGADRLNGWYEGASGYSEALGQYLTSDKPMIVYFYASWCGYCKQLEKNVLKKSAVSSELGNLIKVRIDYEDGVKEDRLSKKYKAEVWPSLYIHLPSSVQSVDSQAAIKMRTPENTSQFKTRLASILDLGKNADAAIDYAKPLQAKMSVTSKSKSSNPKRKGFSAPRSSEPTHVLNLKNGKTIFGRVISEDEGQVVFDEKEIGEIVFFASEIESLEPLS